jgi:threonine aldolase
MDGARIANAAATLGLPLRAFTSDVGVDVVSLGGTKNGAMAAEAIVVLDPDAADGLRFLRKSQMQLASKMRFVSAQLLALYEGDLWLRSARHANEMAHRLAAGVRDLPGVDVVRPVESNAVFAILPRDAADRVREDFWFYDWDEATGEVRWMCAFDTTEQDVDAFVAAVARAVRA